MDAESIHTAELGAWACVPRASTDAATERAEGRCIPDVTRATCSAPSLPRSVIVAPLPSRSSLSSPSSVIALWLRYIENESTPASASPTYAQHKQDLTPRPCTQLCMSPVTDPPVPQRSCSCARPALPQHPSVPRNGTAERYSAVGALGVRTSAAVARARLVSMTPP